MKAIKRCIILVMCLAVSFSVFPFQHQYAFGAEKVSINKAQATIWVKNYMNLKVIGTTSKVVWKSSNTKIATVNSAGKVVGVTAGKAIITATVSKKKYTCSVTVKKEKNIQPLQDLLEDIKENIIEDKTCKILDENYSFIEGYLMMDCNNDGLKELLILTMSDTIICTVKNGKVVVAGKLSYSVDEESSLYYNKESNSIVTISKSEFYEIDRRYYMNNAKLYKSDTQEIRKVYGYSMSGGVWLYTKGALYEDKEISKKQYDTIHNEYYKTKDLQELKFEEIVY